MNIYRQSVLGLGLLMMGVLVACGGGTSGGDATLTFDQATEQARVSGFIPITRNEDWIPVEREFDGVVMVLVPAGCFMMGEDTLSGYTDYDPRHEQCFDTPFWIDKYEVTNKQFRDFGGVAGRNSNWTGDDLPRERITWFEARDFCQLRGGRLPTEAEWEYAARGPNSLIYPWGDKFDGTRLNFCDINCPNGWRYTTVNDGYANTAPVGSYPNGVSWVGAMDMSGNVSEWALSLYKGYPYDLEDGREDDTYDGTIFVTRSSRGGSFVLPPENLRAPYRYRHYPSMDDNELLGFRCLRIGS